MATTYQAKNLGKAMERLGKALALYPAMEGMTLREALHGDSRSYPAQWALGDCARFLGWDWRIPKAG